MKVKMQILKSAAPRLCKDCVYLRPNPKFWGFDKNATIFGHCGKFGKIDLVTGDIEYSFASVCRDNDTQCGKEGTQFSAKNINAK